MKIIISLVLTVLVFTTCQAQKQKQLSDWFEFISKSGNFKVWFPTKPNESAKEIEENGLKTQSYWFSVSQPLKTFMITYADYPNAPVMNQEQLRLNYNNLKSNIIERSNSKLTSERDVFLNERLGREFTFVSVDKITVTYRTYLIDKRFFQLITSIESPLAEDEETKKEVNKFLDSFQILSN